MGLAAGFLLFTAAITARVCISPAAAAPRLYIGMEGSRLAVGLPQSLEHHLRI